MLFGLIGAEHKTGVFEGANYNNFNLHVTEAINNDGAGYKSSVLKVKSSVLENLSGCDSKNIDSFVYDMVGNNIDVYFDKYGRVDTIKSLEDK